MAINYKKSGVDIHRMDNLKKKMKSIVRGSFRPEVLKDIGGFGGFFRFPKNKYKDPVLVSSSDGVGTKLKIAELAGKHDTVGIDSVAMNVNDILCTGAEPLFFLDYIAFSKLDDKTLLDVVKGVNTGCCQSGCSLVGGETAQMPGMYRPGEYDLAGFCVGVVEKNKIIDGKKIKPGEAIIGLESSGIHSNGYSLVRESLSLQEQKRFCAQLLKPTRIYVKPVLEVLCKFNVSGVAHITGGAFYDKIARILPDNAAVNIYKCSWPIQKIFKLIQSRGKISDKDMYHTFNMGIGMVLVTKLENVDKIIRLLSTRKVKAWVIGEVIKGRKEVKVI
ncbi:MAG: phosphoribosylformylglycinamidine cyclo-ligase [Candidatus Omnitrophica bacterium]|nr:phosphoribosylformylglycinamidine cyclo-ligase [Candidatus Omnitrophota bacterium]